MFLVAICHILFVLKGWEEDIGAVVQGVAFMVQLGSRVLNLSIDNLCETRELRLVTVVIDFGLFPGLCLLWLHTTRWNSFRLFPSTHSCVLPAMSHCFSFVVRESSRYHLVVYSCYSPNVHTVVTEKEYENIDTSEA